MLSTLERMRLIEATVDRPDWFTVEERAGRIAEVTDALRSDDNATAVAAAETLLAMDAVNTRREAAFSKQATGEATERAENGPRQTS